ncbi:MAG: hypothetical protein ACLFU3_09620 [Dichotomicrobium sp.]
MTNDNRPPRFASCAECVETLQREVAGLREGDFRIYPAAEAKMAFGPIDWAREQRGTPSNFTGPNDEFVELLLLPLIARDEVLVLRTNTGGKA